MRWWRVAAVVGFSVGAGGCRTPPVTEGTAPPAAEEPQVILHGVRMQMFRGSDLMMLGRAARLSYLRNSADMTATEGLLVFPSREGGVRAPGMAISGLEVRAPVVDGNLYTRQATAKGGVLLRTSSGMVGRTEAAQFDGAAMRLWGTDPVEVEGPGYTLDAGGFLLLFEQEQFEFTGGTQTVLGRTEKR